MFDPRILSLAPFVPHPLATVQGALPPGAIDAAIYDNIQKKYARLAAQAIERMEYMVGDARVSAVIARPANVTPKGHPILIFNRGGSGDYGMLVLPTILRYGLPFAEAGMLVFASNYRGNDGSSGADEFGGRDVDDVLTLLDIAKQHPGWDGTNIYMLGASRGGMMTYLAIKRGAALNAAATFGAITDLASPHGNWPALVARFHDRIADPKPSIETMMRDRSAVQWPHTLANVPLLLMHGDADSTVEVEQARALATALDGVHANFRLVEYAGGNHSLSTHMGPMLHDTLAWFTQFRR